MRRMVNGRNTIRVKIGRALQALPLAWLRPVERLLLPGSPIREPNMIFLIAAPRSGSTVCYQTLVHTLQPMYLSNLWNMLYQVPLMGGALSGIKCGAHASTFTSFRGFVDGLCGPAEGMRFWQHWLGQGLQESVHCGHSLEFSAKAEHIRRVFSHLSRPWRPFVGGYIGHTLAVAELRRIFPTAVFIHLQRDLADNAMSILSIRRELPLGSDFSVQPREWDKFRHDGRHYEAAAQAWLIDRRVRSTLDPLRTIEVRYEDLCSNPTREVLRIIEFCNSNGFELEMKAQLPMRLGGGPRTAKESADLQKIKEILGELDSAAQIRERIDE